MLLKVLFRIGVSISAISFPKFQGYKDDSDDKDDDNDIEEKTWEVISNSTHASQVFMDADGTIVLGQDQDAPADVYDATQSLW